MTNPTHALLLILTMAAATALLRFLPFVLFSKGTPKAVLYLGKVLPPATMAMLVVYCLRNVSFAESPHGIPEAASVLLTAALYKWRHNTLLAILGGTISYMIFIRVL